MIRPQDGGTGLPVVAPAATAGKGLAEHFERPSQGLRSDEPRGDESSTYVGWGLSVYRRTGHRLFLCGDSLTLLAHRSTTPSKRRLPLYCQYRSHNSLTRANREAPAHNGSV